MLLPNSAAPRSCETALSWLGRACDDSARCFFVGCVFCDGGSVCDGEKASREEREAVNC